MTPNAPKPWPDVLAAYADGELGPADQADVDRRLRADPTARAELEGQRQLSPENWCLWQGAEPPMPTDTTWGAVGQSVAAALRGPRRSPGAGRRGRPGRWLSGAAGAAVAASVLAIGGGLFTPAPAPQAEDAPGGPLAGFAVLPLAADADVEVHRVGEPGAAWLPVGADPLPEALVLASSGDVQLDAVHPQEGWPAGGPQITPRAGDAPMLFAATPR